MRVVVFAKATEDSESVPPTPEAFEAMDRFTDELFAAGGAAAASLIALMGLALVYASREVRLGATRPAA